MQPRQMLGARHADAHRRHTIAQVSVPTALGGGIIALLTASSLVTFIVYRVKRYDEIGARSR